MRAIGSDAIRSKENGEISVSTEKSVQTVKDFFAAIGRGDREGVLALVAEDVEWIIPGEDWPLAGTRRGHVGLTDLLETASKAIETSTEPRSSSAGRPGSGRRFRQGQGQGHEQGVRGPFRLRHHRSKRQAGERPGVYRHGLSLYFAGRRHIPARPRAP